MEILCLHDCLLVWRLYPAGFRGLLCENSSMVQIMLLIGQRSSSLREPHLGWLFECEKKISVRRGQGGQGRVEKFAVLAYRRSSINEHGMAGESRYSSGVHCPPRKFGVCILGIIERRLVEQGAFLFLARKAAIGNYCLTTGAGIPTHAPRLIELHGFQSMQQMQSRL